MKILTLSACISVTLHSQLVVSFSICSFLSLSFSFSSSLPLLSLSPPSLSLFFSLSLFLLLNVRCATKSRRGRIAEVPVLLIVRCRVCECPARPEVARLSLLCLMPPIFLMTLMPTMFFKSLLLRCRVSTSSVPPDAMCLSLPTTLVLN